MYGLSAAPARPPAVASMVPLVTPAVVVTATVPVDTMAIGRYAVGRSAGSSQLSASAGTASTAASAPGAVVESSAHAARAAARDRDSARRALREIRSGRMERLLESSGRPRDRRQGAAAGGDQIEVDAEGLA